MQLQVITFYCACADYLTSSGHHDDPQARMTRAEIMTCVLTALWFFGGNLRSACAYLHESGAMPQMLGESRFNRQMHRIRPQQWQGVLHDLHTRRQQASVDAAAAPADAQASDKADAANADPADAGASDSTYIVDSCPFLICHKARAERRKLYPQEQPNTRHDAYLGYCASKDEYYIGLKAHLIVDAQGRPVEVLLLCGCGHDLTGLKEMTLDLPQGAQLYADKAYNDYDYEAHLQDEQQLTLLPLRKDNSKRPHSEELSAKISHTRKRIETTFSQVTARLARRIAAVTERGFEAKIMALFVAYAILG